MNNVNLVEDGKTVAGPFVSFGLAEDWLVDNGYARFEGDNNCWRKGNSFIDIVDD